MRLKILPLMILFLLLLTRISFAQMPAELPDAQSNDYGIEPGQSYPGTLVLELMTAAEAEIDAAVREAYAEGYKAASLRFMLELAAKDQEIALLNMTLKVDRRKYWRNTFIAGGLSFLGGTAVGIIIAGR